MSVEAPTWCVHRHRHLLPFYWSQMLALLVPSTIGVHRVAFWYALWLPCQCRGQSQTALGTASACHSGESSHGRSSLASYFVVGCTCSWTDPGWSTAAFRRWQRRGTAAALSVRGFSCISRWRSTEHQTSDLFLVTSFTLAIGTR